MRPPEPNVVRDYTALVREAIWNLRMRLRYGEKVTEAELIDYLDAIENIPTMLLDYGKWHVEENIDWHLAQYDERWRRGEGSTLRISLLDTLRRIRKGDAQPPRK